MYTAREQLKENFKAALEAIHKLGYPQLGAMDMSQRKDLIPIAQNLGLQVNSSFFSWTYLTERWDLAQKAGKEKIMRTEVAYVIEEAAKYGLEYLIFGYIYLQKRATR